MEKSSLTALATQLMDAARGSSSGRSAQTVYGGPARILGQTVLALRAGESLAEHENPGEASLYVLQGRVRLATRDASDEGVTGDLLVVPDSRHTLTATEDAVVLLTVAKHT
ncbi:LuxR family transcriptional regulator [Catellatospora sp. IY07-71]|uniref:LuxR family transcriptional regulator n=1 Tax=Catellatospora sp. IY07-71 TaxID=2728827 RepID=UPI001BB3F48D|nr:LuxR family transcriptional regulator [Catellatospora sp. IY07-71]BCJ75838.1 LuxR family transcriptional regulator [Catellatospora sp. IY07-71]